MSERLDRKCLRAMWKDNRPIRSIAWALGVDAKTVKKAAERMGLPKRKQIRMGLVFGEARKNPHSNRGRSFVSAKGHGIGGNIKHRMAIAQPDPIRLRPSQTLFGAPIRDLDPETRSLIDDALSAYRTAGIAIMIPRAS